MNSWSARRKRIVFSLVSAALILLVGVPLFFIFYNAPTCFDNKANGDEAGVDCGGSCELLCSAQSLPILSQGDPQVIEVASGLYEVVHVVENPNVRGEARAARYVINIFDVDKVVPIKIIEGETYVPPNSTFAIFEGPFNLEAASTTRATFKWKEESLVWKKNTDPVPELLVREKILKNGESSPRLEAKLSNMSLDDVKNIEVVALLRDEGGSIVAASRTIVDSLRGGESAPVIFTWPEPFRDAVGLIDILPRSFPDRSFLR